MRTSLNIPDALLEEARRRASAERSTITDLIVEALRERLSIETQADEVKIVTLPTRDLGSPRVDLDDNRAVREALEADEDSPFRAHP